VIVFVLTILPTPVANAVPATLYIAVDGVIEDMWLGEDRCWFSIEVEWSDHSEVIGGNIDCVALYLNESTGHYGMIRSSQGWQIGDHLNCTVEHDMSEWGDCYFIWTTSKSDINYATEPQHDSNMPLISATAFALLGLIVVLALLVWIRKRQK
jgi:hypothetical protein